MDAYEIRLQLVLTAKDLIENQTMIQNQARDKHYDTALQIWLKDPLTAPKPNIPVYDSISATRIIQEANQLYDFVSSNKPRKQS